MLVRGVRIQSPPVLIAFPRVQCLTEILVISPRHEPRFSLHMLVSYIRMCPSATYWKSHVLTCDGGPSPRPLELHY